MDMCDTHTHMHARTRSSTSPAARSSASPSVSRGSVLLELVPSDVARIVHVDLVKRLADLHVGMPREPRLHQLRVLPHRQLPLLPRDLLVTIFVECVEERA